MSISVSMIIKDEEKVLPRCLKCIDFADEIVIVDTGSTDTSMEIASAHPKVKLYKSERFDKDTHYSDFEFGVARNESVRKCEGDWIIYWDADDVIDKDMADNIRALDVDESCVYSMRNTADNMGHVEQMRMWRNGNGVLFDETHACHEYIVYGNLPVVPMWDIIIPHEPVERAVSRESRNVCILEKDFYDRRRRDPRTMFYLGCAYQASGRNANAVAMFDQYLAVSEWDTQRHFARCYKALSLHMMQYEDEAIRECVKAIGEDDRFAMPHCLMGVIEVSRYDLDKAEEHFKKAMAIPMPRIRTLFLHPKYYKEFPEENLKNISRIRQTIPDWREKKDVSVICQAITRAVRRQPKVPQTVGA